MSHPSTPLAATPRRDLAGDVLSALRAIAGADGVIAEHDRLLAYESDALTTLSGLPLAAVLPGDRDSLVRVVRTLHAAGVPFVPRGSGTGLSGAAVAREAVLVCTTRLNRILDVDAEAGSALVEPGVITGDISAAAARHGLRYLPDPASAAACTVGGNVAMNSGGPHCLKHGVTTDHLLDLEIVLPDGTRHHLRRGEDGGLDLAGLLAGSEGTLGIVSRIRVRLVRTAPAVRALLALFDSIRAAGAAVSDVLSAGVLPVAVEIIDRETIAVVESSVYAAGLPTDVAAALVVECEGEPEAVADELEKVESIARRNGAREVRLARDEAEREAIWQARKKAYGALGRLAPDVLVQDAVVPRTALPELLPAIEEVARRYELRLASFFHAGDGNLHPNLLFDRRDPDQVERVERSSAEIMRLCVEKGGTITGEHGVGLDKLRYMSLIFGHAELAAQRRLKAVFDPAGLCNGDKMLPDAGLATDDGARAAGGTPPGAEDTEARAPRAAPVATGRTDSTRSHAVEPPDVAELAEWIRGLAGSFVPVVTGRSIGADDGWHERALATAEADGTGPPAALVSTGALTGIVDFRPDDLTITVQAGMRVERLQAIVADQGLWLPVQGRAAARSVGGLVAAASAGPFDATYGPVRRHVLACRVVTSGGEERTWGRPVVKNVAGYDIPRLMCGSRGRLGVITQVTLRLWPLPATRRVYGLEAETGAATVSRALSASDGPPVTCASWEWSPAGGDEVQVTLCGSEADVSARDRSLHRWAESREVVLRALPESEGSEAEDRIRSSPRQLSAAVFRVTANRPYLGTVLERLRGGLGPELVRSEAYPATGVVVLDAERGEAAPGRAAPGWLARGLSADGESNGRDRAATPAGSLPVSVERGGPAEHAAARALREPGVLRLEEGLIRALGGWPRHWLADYV